MLRVLIPVALLINLVVGLDQRGRCGMKGASDRIVGGAEADMHTWPWQVSLRSNHWLWGSRHICGATILSEKWILTAAHCVDGSTASSMRVVLGDHNKEQQQPSEKEFRLNRIIMHELYDGNSLQTDGLPYDIALLEVDTPIEFNTQIQPACLPTHEDMDVVGNNNCWISGWGLTKGTQDENVLQELNIEIRSNADCGSIWPSHHIHDSHICVGYGSSGACNGDSGGPISCGVNGRYYVMGAASWVASGCTTPGYPSVYTRVSKYLDWINEKTA